MHGCFRAILHTAQQVQRLCAGEVVPTCVWSPGVWLPDDGMPHLLGHRVANGVHSLTNACELMHNTPDPQLITVCTLQLLTDQ